MENNKLGSAIAVAQGERSLREYARAAGVDPGLLSRIKSGKYIPHKLQIYRDLTSEKAAPRGGITYEKLIEAAGFSTSYTAGVMAGMAATEGALAMLGGLPIATLLGTTISNMSTLTDKIVSQKKAKEDIDKVINDTQRFAASAMGLIYSKLAIKGISFRPDETKKLLKNELDMYVEIVNEDLNNWLFGYIYIDPKEKEATVLIESTARRNIERLVFINPDEKLKVSIVTNSKEVYDYLVKYKGKLAYRGNLSVIYVDMEKISIVDEEYISFYQLGDKRELLKII